MVYSVTFLLNVTIKSIIIFFMFAMYIHDDEELFQYPRKGFPEALKEKLFEIVDLFTDKGQENRETDVHTIALDGKIKGVFVVDNIDFFIKANADFTFLETNFKIDKQIQEKFEKLLVATNSISIPKEPSDITEFTIKVEGSKKYESIYLSDIAEENIEGRISPTDFTISKRADPKTYELISEHFEVSRLKNGIKFIELFFSMYHPKRGRQETRSFRLPSKPPLCIVRYIYEKDLELVFFPSGDVDVTVSDPDLWNVMDRILNKFAHI